MDDIKRGEIYYVNIPSATGHEMQKDRPGIIVSCDELNRSSPTVAVVMCSASYKRDLPEHIAVRSTPLLSTAMCEHIYTVDKTRLGKFMGRCSKAEMAAVDIGIMSGLGLGAYDLARPVEASPECMGTSNTWEAKEALVRAEEGRSIYKGLYDGLLECVMMMERREEKKHEMLSD